AESALSPGSDDVLPVLDRGWKRPLPVCVLRYERGGGVRFGRLADAQAMVRRRHPAQCAPLCLRRDGPRDAGAYAALFRLRSAARLPLILLGHRRRPDLA